MGSRIDPTPPETRKRIPVLGTLQRIPDERGSVPPRKKSCEHKGAPQRIQTKERTIKGTQEDEEEDKDMSNHFTDPYSPTRDRDRLLRITKARDNILEQRYEEELKKRKTHSTYNYTNYYSRFRIYIGRPETVQEASDRFDEEKKHSFQHGYFCKADFCIHHYWP